MNRIGKYEVIAPLGQGGSGRVFRAYDPVIARPVAIKFLTDTLDSTDLAKLRSEARAAGRLHHRNVVSIFGLEIDDDKPFLVMELLEGEDLSNSLPPGTQMGIWQATEIMHQVAEGLQHAHNNSVVHRDVSPQNIWLLPDGTVKVIDFGIAGFFQGNRTTTSTISPMGTLLFFSPEHLAESPTELDPRSDIFSFGSVFYQLLAGRNPFEGRDDRETVCNILMHEPDPLADFRPDCPPVLAKIIHRALLKDLDLRYPSFQDLLSDLDPVLMELRRPKADELLRTAQQALAENQVDQAKTALGRVLELAPERKEARDLLDQLKDKQRENTVRAKLQTLLVDADQKSQERKFRESILTLEKAQRLDPESSEVSKRLEEVRSARARHEKCLGLIKRAEEFRKGGKLDEALAAGVEAVEADSGEPEAARLAERLRSEVEADHRKRVSEGLANARQLLKEEQFVAAEAVLGSLLERFAEASEAQPLLSYARSEMAKRNRRRTVENARNEAIRRAAFGEYSTALAAIDLALEQYPDDPDLTLLRIATQASMVQQSRRSSPSQAGEGDSSGRVCVCGNSLKAGAKFCDRCGAPSSPSPPKR